jgi:cell division protein ZipA
MPELRWTLLIIGVLFVIILAWWERRRPHQASRQAPHIGEEPRPVAAEDWGTNASAAREPSLTLPEIRTESRSSAAVPPPQVHVERERTSPKELPIVEIPDDSLIGLRVEAEPDFEDEEADEVVVEDDELESVAEGVGEVQVIESEPAVDLPPPPTEFSKPIVEWPPEDQRKIVSLRLVARPPDRFRGNLLRQALAAEGFVLGDFDIFHKPDANNRAVLSASNLSKPGTFDIETMDTQRFVGLSLLAVLPGPKSPQKAFEDLLMAARMLNERLEGALQDDKGGPLTPMRIQALRDSLGAEAKS